MSKVRKKVDGNVNYIKTQIRLVLERYYRLKVEVKVFANKELKKEKRYSRTTFPKHEYGGVEVDIEYGLIRNGKKQQLLETAYREAIRIAIWKTRRGYRNGSRDYEIELRKYGIKSYGTVPEMGMELHTYSCEGCSKVWLLQAKKLPRTRDPEQLGLRSKCCGGLVKYSGKVFYENEKLQRIHKNRKG